MDNFGKIIPDTSYNLGYIEGAASVQKKLDKVEAFLKSINDALHDKDNNDSIESDPHGGALMCDWIRREFETFYKESKSQDIIG
jgi:hypothetical protein